jgi:hypothetical protein
MPPLPTATLDVTPTADEVASFVENGYLVVDRITTDDELVWLTEIYESVFSPDGAGGRLGPFDFGGEGDGNGGDGPALLGQAFFPETTYPELLGTVYQRNARRYAAALLGVDIGELSSWSHMIRKLPGGREAPWHQDEAYWDPELSYHALGCWLPLHDVTVDMGAMQFIPGSHREGLRHHSHIDDDPVLHLLVADGVDTSRAAACPLPAGGATFHHHRTLHHTAVNVTDRPRLAFPTEFQTPPRRVASPDHRPWVDAHRAATGAGPPLAYPADGRFLPV